MCGLQFWAFLSVIFRLPCLFLSVKSTFCTYLCLWSLVSVLRVPVSMWLSISYTFGGEVQFYLFRVSVSFKGCLSNLVCGFQFLRNLPFLRTFQFYPTVVPLWLNTGVVSCISTWSWRQNQNYESIYSSWINGRWFFCHSIDKVQCKQAHRRCVCILETERTGSSECHLFVIQTKMNLIVREHHFTKSLAKQNFESPFLLCSQTLSLWWSWLGTNVDWILITWNFGAL